MPSLSILICSIHTRAAMLKRLLAVLQPQITDNPNVELLIDTDNGEVSIGAKRQRMLKQAQGDFVCFIDDDDMVSTRYVAAILEAIARNPLCDCVGFKAKVCMFGNPAMDGETTYSLRYQQWRNQPNNQFERTPGHLNPIRRELALQVGYKDLDWAEDRDFSERLQPLLKTEEFINEYLYWYLYRLTAQRQGEITHAKRVNPQ